MPRTLSRRLFLRHTGSSALAMALLAACAPDSVPTPVAVTPPPTRPADGEIPATDPHSLDALADSTPAPIPAPAVTLAEKVGQMIMVGFRGLSVDENSPIVRHIQESHIGSVVLFDYDAPTRTYDRNIQSPAQVAALTAALQAFSPTPLLIATDQEGGKVARLSPKWGFPATLSAQELGEMEDLEYVAFLLDEMAATVDASGINLNLAPVVDLNTNPDNPVIGAIGRSFGADAQVVIDHALTFIGAHRRQGVLTTLKHFPGHGSSTADSHKGFVDVTDSWSRRELTPYGTLIQQGAVDTIMTAHVFNEELDRTYPATLSKATITDLLRDELGFKGVVISDDMQMGAIADLYPYADAVALAINAGVDMLAIANNSVYDEAIAPRTADLILGMVADGRIPVSRIDESYARIMALKVKLR